MNSISISKRKTVKNIKKGLMMNQLEADYFKLVFKEKLCTYKRIDEYTTKPIGTASERYQKHGKIKAFLAEQLNVTPEKIEKLETFFKPYQELNNKYNNEAREELFKDPELLLEWWYLQGNKCGYCGITQEELKRIVVKRGDNLTLNGGQKRSKGSLEIENTDPDPAKRYTFKNVILACPLCNNGKSNLINENDWRRFFAVPMRNYYELLLGEPLSSPLPEKTLHTQG